MLLHYLGKVNSSNLLLRFEKVIGKSLVASFFGTRCSWIPSMKIAIVAHCIMIVNTPNGGQVSGINVIYT